jgi:hypothetical protein
MLCHPGKHRGERPRWFGSDIREGLPRQLPSGGTAGTPDHAIKEGPRNLESGCIIRAFVLLHDGWYLFSGHRTSHSLKEHDSGSSLVAGPRLELNPFDHTKGLISL